jgi:hypothetical protein
MCTLFSRSLPLKPFRTPLTLIRFSGSSCPHNNQEYPGNDDVQLNVVHIMKMFIYIQIHLNTYTYKYKYIYIYICIHLYINLPGNFMAKHKRELAKMI